YSSSSALHSANIRLSLSCNSFHFFAYSLSFSNFHSCVSSKGISFDSISLGLYAMTSAILGLYLLVLIYCLALLSVGSSSPLLVRVLTHQSNIRSFISSFSFKL